MNMLIPRDHWEHRVTDSFGGLMAGLSGGSPGLELTLPGIGVGIAVRSGRLGIATALRALQLPQGAGVAVPLYCCPVVFQAIAAAGFSPRFIDVDPATYRSAERRV